MWVDLGFKNSPYNAEPLKPVESDVDLLVGRSDEIIEFCTLLETRSNGVCVISGTPGVGKTSFFNVTQYLLENKQASYGPQFLSSRMLCPINPGDTPATVARRVVTYLCQSIEQYCKSNGIDIPTQINKIYEWVNCSSCNGFEVGLQILGTGASFGRTMQLPDINNVTFEGFQNAITCISSEVVNTLGYEGMFIALDNVENLSNSQLTSLLMAFRDTLFTIPKVWWVIIGQSGLYSLIETLDPRVAERINGTGLELQPITLVELYDAIEKRVNQFHIKPNGKAPLPASTHQRLYNASNGEIRFVLKYCNDICSDFVVTIRKRMEKELQINKPKHFHKAIGEYMISNQIPEEIASMILKRIIGKAIDGLKLNTNEKHVLALISANRGAKPSDYKLYNCNNASEFSRKYLQKFFKSNLLAKRQEGRTSLYTIRGVAALAAIYDIIKPGQ